MSAFAPTEPKRYARQKLRKPDKIRKPPTKRKERYKKLYEKVNTVRNYDTFDEWLDSLRTTPKMRSEAAKWFRYRYRGPPKLTAASVALLTVYLFSKLSDVSADVGTQVMAELCENEGIGCPIPESPPMAIGRQPAMTKATTLPMTGSEKRRVNRDRRKQRLARALSTLAEARELRLPEKGNWLQYMAGTLADDDAYFEKEMIIVNAVLREVSTLVDGPLDGAGDGMVKREYMQPIMTPIVYDLALNALRTDWAFVNASFHKNMDGDRVSAAMQRQRANKIVRRLADNAEIDIAQRDVVSQLIRHVDSNPEAWYKAKEKRLEGTAVVNFLRTTTKRYVRKALGSIPEDDEAATKDALHVAAVIDVSLSGKAIQQRAGETAATDAIEGALYNSNPLTRHILDKYKLFLNEQRTPTRRHAINALLSEDFTSAARDKIVRDVKLLWSIYDEEADTTFSARERDRYASMAEQFLGRILLDDKLRNAEYRGHAEGRAEVNSWLHAWANKLLAGIFLIVAGVGKLGCPRCRLAARRRARKAVSTDVVRNMKVYQMDTSNKLWIRENNLYKRISSYGHPNYFTRIREQRSVARTRARYVGEIDAAGQYQPN